MSASAVIDAEGAVAFLFDIYDGLRRFTPLFEHQVNAINRGLRGNPNGLRRGYLAAVVVEEAELFRQRVTLCDLLWGRSMRMRASKELENVLELERHDLPFEVVTRALDRAAHMEWVAARAEQGLVLWGERNNRFGFAEDERRLLQS